MQLVISMDQNVLIHFPLMSRAYIPMYGLQLWYLLALKDHIFLLLRLQASMKTQSLKFYFTHTLPSQAVSKSTFQAKKDIKKLNHVYGVTWELWVVIFSILFTVSVFIRVNENTQGANNFSYNWWEL